MKQPSTTPRPRHSDEPVSVCQRCGLPLPDGEWAGTCPRCLIAAFAEEEKEGVEFVPGFVVQEEIARGGMGIVYRAVQRHSGRLVALKMILPHLLDSSQVRARFRAEVKSVARLDHPNVLPIYEAGENRGPNLAVNRACARGSWLLRREAYSTLTSGEFFTAISNQATFCSTGMSNH